MSNGNLNHTALVYAKTSTTKKENMHDIRDTVKHIGKYFSNPLHLEPYGQLIDVRHSSNAEMSQFRRAMPRIQNRRIDGSTDNEAMDAIQKFFWGQRNGIVLELGAADGNEASESLPLMSLLGWHRVLIEGSPVYTKNIAQRAPDALSINCAVCAQEGIVHYASRGLVSGILEFMEPSFLTTFYPDLKNVTDNKIAHRDVWKNYTRFVTPVHCYPLSKILHHANLTHINYFILDTEGAELEILKTISWDRIRFDIVTIETEKSLRPLFYAENITAYMVEHGYVHLMNSGRNSWYKHRDYDISSAPSYDFKGHIYDTFFTAPDFEYLNVTRTSEQMVYLLFDSFIMVLLLLFVWRIWCRNQRFAKGREIN